MNFVIRKDQASYMAALKAWLKETEEDTPEEMSAFFSSRLDIYEEHMSAWAEGYRKLAALLPGETRTILDLGPGTGLELDEIFLLFPEAEVTGIDLCKDMLVRLSRKHPDKKLTLRHENYCLADFADGSNVPGSGFDAVVSFESLHHLLPEDKSGLYRRIFRALKPGGVFLNGDYIACCEEEENLLREAFLKKRNSSEFRLLHLDIPLTLSHELCLLKEAGFEAEPVCCENGATILRAYKRG